MRLLLADIFPSLYKGLPVDSDGHTQIQSLMDLIIIVGNLIQILMALGIVLATIYITWGGIQYVISQGDPGKTKTARNTITNAAVGIVLSAAAYLIVEFLTRQF